MSEQGADTSVAVWGCWGGGVLGSQGQEWEWLDSGLWQPCGVPVEVTGPSPVAQLCLRPTEPQAEVWLEVVGGEALGPRLESRREGAGTVSVDSIRSSHVGTEGKGASWDFAQGENRLWRQVRSWVWEGPRGGGRSAECPMALLSAPLSWAGKVGVQGHSARCSPSLWKGSARASGPQLARLGVQEALRGRLSSPWLPLLALPAALLP